MNSPILAILGNYGLYEVLDANPIQQRVLLVSKTESCEILLRFLISSIDMIDVFCYLMSGNTFRGKHEQTVA